VLVAVRYAGRDGTEIELSSILTCIPDGH